MAPVDFKIPFSAKVPSSPSPPETSGYCVTFHNPKPQVPPTFQDPGTGRVTLTYTLTYLPGPIATRRNDTPRPATVPHNVTTAGPLRSLCPSPPAPGSKVVTTSHPPHTDGGRDSSSPQSRSPSPEGEQLPPPPWPGPPPCSPLPGIPAPRTWYGPAWHAWRPWGRPAPAGTRRWAAGSVSDSPAPTRPDRSRRLGPAQPSRTREETVKKRGQPGS